MTSLVSTESPWEECVYKANLVTFQLVGQEILKFEVFIASKIRKLNKNWKIACGKPSSC